MAVESPQERGDVVSLTASALRALADAATAAAASGSSVAALAAFARAAAEACAADVSVVRVLDADGEHLRARAVYSESPSLAALLEGSRIPVAELGGVEPSRAPHLGVALHLPVKLGGTLLGSLEILRAGAAFDEGEELVARIAADQLALALHVLGRAAERNGEGGAEQMLVLAGEALVAGADEARTAAQVARLAADAAGAEASFLWHASEGEPELSGSYGETEVDEPALVSAARVALQSHDFLTQERIAGAAVASARLGEPPTGVLQLVFADDPDERSLAGLATFALRAAHALEAGELARRRTLELERTRALLAVVGQATAQLSLAHTLSTGIERTAELLDVERVAVYLREEGRLHPAAGRALAGAHVFVAETLLSLLLGPFRGRGIVSVPDVTREPLLASVRGAAAESGIEAAVALPLIARQDVIGLLAVYPELGRTVSEHEESLLAALAAHLAVAVQNASLHEQTQQLARDREQALDAERDAARRMRALYEVSSSFAESLNLQDTLDALAHNAVELLDVDAAVVRMPDERGELWTERASDVAEPRLDAAARAMLTLPQKWNASAQQHAVVLDPAVARELGGSHALLVPFLEKGSTAAVLPIVPRRDVVATLTIVSFDPGRPIGEATLETALSIVGQVALAIDNGLLSQQRQQFLDTMQRSLLPERPPDLPGLEIGDVYESSARVDIGGDVYDFVELGDGRLGVALGDVTGHGIDATADMAMAKFVFRSLTREHPEPGDFLSKANDVVVGEIAPGKFITMAYLTVDAATGTVAAASAGHPPPLVVRADGRVAPLEVRGLALGVDMEQAYVEDSAVLDPGSAVVVYTDGVLEARRDGELYGPERLAEVLAASRALPAAEIARAVVRDCRAFGGGQLGDDCAVVVIKKDP